MLCSVFFFAAPAMWRCGVRREGERMKIFIRERFLIYVTKIFYVRCFFLLISLYLSFIHNYYCASIPVSLSALCFFVATLSLFSLTLVLFCDFLILYFLFFLEFPWRWRVATSIVDWISSIDSSQLDHRRERNAFSQIVWALIANCETKTYRFSFLHR